MRVFKTTYKDKRGKTKEAAKWYVEFRDQLDTIRRLPAHVSKAASEELGRNLEKLVAFHKASGGQTDPALTRFLAGLESRTIEKLVAIGLLDANRVGMAKTITEHLADWQADLRARGVTNKQVELVAQRAGTVIERCHFAYAGDLSASRVQAVLAELRGEGLGLRSCNFYLRAIKQFARWLVRDRRLAESPLTHLTGWNAETDIRHGRRALTVPELQSILAVALVSPVEFRGFSGRDRHFLYLTAMVTGFRVSELGSVTPESFDVFGEMPAVTGKAAYTKNRKLAVQPLPVDVAEALRAYMAEKPAGQPVWPGTWTEKAAKMLRIDLGAAGVPYVTDGPSGPEYADFHALRHSFITNVVNSGVNVKLAQTLARHSTVQLTLGRYTHVGLHDGAAAVDALPKLLPEMPGREALRATGTDGAQLGQKNLASCLSFSERFQATGVDSGGRDTEKATCEQATENTGKTRDLLEKTHYARRDSNPQPTVPKTVATDAQPVATTIVAENPQTDLTFCLALLAKKSADLALVVERWDAVPEAIRAGIVAMVKAGDTRSHS